MNNTTEIIHNHCAEFFGVSPESIAAHCRKRERVDIRRNLASWLRMHRYTYIDIARIIGLKDHSTIGYLLRTHNQFCKFDKIYNRTNEMFVEHMNRMII